MARHTARAGRIDPPARPPHGWREATARYGWRAYALPVLTVITIAALLQTCFNPLPPAEAGEAGGHTASRSVATPDAPLVLSEQRNSDACRHNSAASFVLVSISKQYAWMCQRHQLVNLSPVTTGAVADGLGTPTGSWLLENKQTDRYLTGPGYRDFVHYWIPFNGDFGFHDASWQTSPYGSPDYRTLGSHGCVHVPLAVARWLYSWANTGSTVVTVTD